MIAVLVVFIAANENKRNLMEKYKNETATRQKRESVTVSNVIARKIDTQKNKIGIGHRRDREKRETTATTARNESAC